MTVPLRYAMDVPIGEEAMVKAPWFLVYETGKYRSWTAYRSREEAEHRAIAAGTGFIVMSVGLPVR